MFTHAITRKPGKDFAQGLTTSDLGAPDHAAMLRQHAAYVATLKSLGLGITELEALPGHPDAYFVEDTAIVTPHVGVITRPGAPARRGEEEAMEPVLAGFRPIERIEAPGTVDGGDVLMIENHFFIGVSERTNPEGAQQLGRILAGHGHTFTLVPVAAGLHLKSSVNWVGGKTLLLTASFADREEFKTFERLVLDPAEDYAGNVLLVNEVLIMPSGYPDTRRKLEALGRRILELDTSEARKMDGGLTCMSLRF